MRHLTPKETYAYLNETPDALFVDVRSEIEYLFVGHPPDIEHISWTDFPDWEVNADFVHQVKRLTAGRTDRPVVLLCRSGYRSVEAGNMLEAAGFTDILNVVHGFEGDRDEHHHRNTKNGWRVDGLPWIQS